MSSSFSPMRGRSLGSASSIVPCSAESPTCFATTPSGIGTAASLLIAFLPASMMMCVGVGRLVTVASRVSAVGMSR